MEMVIPKPVSVSRDGGVLRLRAGAPIYVEPGRDDLARIGEYLAAMMGTQIGADKRGEQNTLRISSTPRPCPQREEEGAGIC